MLVVLTTKTRIDLVTEEYYPKELVYEEHLSKIRNAREKGIQIEVKTTAEHLTLVFPKRFAPADSISGTVTLYFPADKYGDKTFELNLDSAYKQNLPLVDLRSGKYEVQIDWHSLDTAYFQKEIIILN